VTTTRFTYRQLVALVEGDDELIARLVDEGIIERKTGDIVLVDIDRVLVARTLWRDLALDWSSIDIVLRLREELAAARRQIAELEAALAAARRG